MRSSTEYSTSTLTLLPSTLVGYRHIFLPIEEVILYRTEQEHLPFLLIPQYLVD